MPGESVAHVGHILAVAKRLRKIVGLVWAFWSLVLGLGSLVSMEKDKIEVQRPKTQDQRPFFPFHDAFLIEGSNWERLPIHRTLQ